MMRLIVSDFLNRYIYIYENAFSFLNLRGKFMAKKSKSKDNLIKYSVLGVLILIVAIIALQSSGMTAQFSGSRFGGLQNQQVTLQQIPQTSQPSTTATSGGNPARTATYQGVLDMLNKCAMTSNQIGGTTYTLKVAETVSDSGRQITLLDITEDGAVVISIDGVKQTIEPKIAKTVIYDHVFVQITKVSNYPEQWAEMFIRINAKDCNEKCSTLNSICIFTQSPRDGSLMNCDDQNDISLSCICCSAV